IVQGVREDMISGTPEEYKNLYSKCWDADQHKRPDIEYVHKFLEGMTKILPNGYFTVTNSEDDNNSITEQTQSIEKFY
ncbi:11469_t:CDS:2, partial [Racocetra persica]